MKRNLFPVNLCIQKKASHTTSQKSVYQVDEEDEEEEEEEKKYYVS